jgi:hypothetical protein
MDLVTLAVAKKYTRDQIANAAVGDVDVTAYVNEKVDELINGASGTFDTLSEIETAVKKKVDNTTTVNNKPLSSNITLAASDVGAVPTTRTINNKALSANISLTASDVSAVPTTRTVNGKALSANITLSAGDVGALPDTTTLFSGNYNDLTNKPTIPSIDGLATINYVDNAVSNIILTSEGGKKFKLTVDDGGTLTATEITE